AAGFPACPQAGSTSSKEMATSAKTTRFTLFMGGTPFNRNFLFDPKTAPLYIPLTGSRLLLGDLAVLLLKQCAVKGAGLQRAQLPPGNWFAPPGSNRDGGRGNEAVGAFDEEGRLATRRGCRAIR